MVIVVDSISFQLPVTQLPISAARARRRYLGHGLVGVHAALLGTERMRVQLVDAHAVVHGAHAICRVVVQGGVIAVQQKKRKSINKYITN